MAVVANTIANRGIRYKPYLVDSLYKYGSGELVSKTQPTIAEKIKLNDENLSDYIIPGMIDASRNIPAQYSLSNLGFDVAIKTGTPQTGQDTSEQDSFFIGFAPADNPEIAFAGVIEDGEYSKYMIRDIILAYQECYGLAGVMATDTSLPEEVHADGTPYETTTTTTTTTQVTVTSSSTTAAVQTTTTAPYAESSTTTTTTAPITSSTTSTTTTMPAAQPPQTPQPEDNNENPIG